MSLPTPTNLKTLDYTYKAQPFSNIPSKDSVNLKTLDYTYKAQPFFSVDYPISTSYTPTPMLFMMAQSGGLI
jgi:hypothetical protein